MFIQYTYALLTMIPCPLWFYSRLASAAFLTVVFTWSVYNGSTYYIDVFGKRFQKELESMKAEVAKWQNSSEILTTSPPIGPSSDPDLTRDPENTGRLQTTPPGASRVSANPATDDVSGIPLLNDEVTFKNASATALEGEPKVSARERVNRHS